MFFNIKNFNCSQDIKYLFSFPSHKNGYFAAEENKISLRWFCLMNLFLVTSCNHYLDAGFRFVQLQELFEHSHQSNCLQEGL